jgi:outer membrane protein assembly factor BamB
LIVTASDGQIRQFDPTSGALIGADEIAGGAASAPVVAGNTLYVISKTGQLVAFR